MFRQTNYDPLRTELSSESAERLSSESAESPASELRGPCTKKECDPTRLPGTEPGTVADDSCWQSWDEGTRRLASKGEQEQWRGCKDARATRQVSRQPDVPTRWQTVEARVLTAGRDDRHRRSRVRRVIAAITTSGEISCGRGCSATRSDPTNHSRQQSFPRVLLERPCGS
eukprot:6751495-Prymnesium_polylepis.1